VNTITSTLSQHFGSALERVVLLANARCETIFAAGVMYSGGLPTAMQRAFPGSDPRNVLMRKNNSLGIAVN